MSIAIDNLLIGVLTIYRAIRSGILNPDGASSKYVLQKLRHHGKQGTACLVTLVDRKSRYLLGAKAAQTTAAVKQVMSESIWRQPHLSVTPDRGKEFSNHVQLIEELDHVPFYFPAPQQPWTHGTNERTPRGFRGSISRKGKTSRIPHKITSNGNSTN